jgi:hypothetical protein
MESMDADD